MAFVLLLFVPYLAFCWCLGKAVPRDLAFPGYFHSYSYTFFSSLNYKMTNSCMSDTDYCDLFYYKERCSSNCFISYLYSFVDIKGYIV